MRVFHPLLFLYLSKDGGTVRHQHGLVLIHLAGPRHRLDEMPSLSICQRPTGSGTTLLVSVGL